MTDDSEPNPFDKACSCGAIYNAVYQEAGADCLRGLLDGLLAGNFEDIDEKPCKESLERDAEELSAIGLQEVAAIVAEAAEKAIPRAGLRLPLR